MPKSFINLRYAAKYFGISYKAAAALQREYGLPFDENADPILRAMRREAVQKKASSLLLAACAVYWRESQKGGEEGETALANLELLYADFADLRGHVESLNISRFWQDVPDSLKILNAGAKGDRAPFVEWVKMTLTSAEGEVNQSYLASRLIAPLFGQPDLRFKNMRPGKLISSMFNTTIHRGDLAGYADKKTIGKKTVNLFHDYKQPEDLDL